MLDKTWMSSWHLDPYLAAMQRERGVMGTADHWLTGYETAPRWLCMKASGTELRCGPEGLQLRPPAAEELADAFAQMCADRGTGDDHLLMVPPVDVLGGCLETEERVQLGGALLRDLVGAGL